MTNQELLTAMQTQGNLIIANVGDVKEEPEFRFERRRYGKQTFTWVHVKVDGVWQEIQDPWPCVNPKKSEIKEAAEKLTERIREGVRRMQEEATARRPELKSIGLSRVIGNELHVRKYSDPGHGWLAVPVRWLEEFGIVAQITEYSFISRARMTAYLEEDQDASTFRQVAKEHGFTVFIDERHADKTSPIRSYSSFTTGN